MQTDAPLKRLMALRGADLLPLFGLPAAALLRVESLELTTRARPLDTVLHVRSLGGEEYLHLIEWQGYFDPLVLWRTAGYLVQLKQGNPKLRVVGTLVYLAPEYDVGDRLTQTLDGQAVLDWPLRCVRLWQQDARAAFASGSVGLAVLSPLMHNADATLVEQAVSRVLTQAPTGEHADLLATLAVFAEPLMDKTRLLGLIRKEQIMASSLLSELVEEKVAEEVEAKIAALEAQMQAQLQAKVQAETAQMQAVMADLKLASASLQQQLATQELRQALQASLMEVLLARFPQIPPLLLLDVQRVSQPNMLQRLISLVNRAPDLTAIEQALKQAIAAEDS